MSTTHQLPVPAVHGDAAGVPGAGETMRRRVLIVDDDRSMRMILRRVLEQDRYEILEAEDGHEGVEACRESAPDIVLMDGAMPNMDGISACAAIRKLPGREETPILMITALEDEETINRAFDAGALAYITKPVNWSVLRQRVRRLIKARHAEQHIKYLAFHDALTGLPNRALFLNRLAHTIAQSQRDGRVFAVAFLDLDRFKTVNDTLGHDAGDTLLKTVADRLVTTLRTADTVARPSGDEFVMLLHMTRNADGLGDAARRMLHSISQPMSIVDQELIIGGERRGRGLSRPRQRHHHPDAQRRHCHVQGQGTGQERCADLLCRHGREDPGTHVLGEQAAPGHRERRIFAELSADRGRSNPKGSVGRSARPLEAPRDRLRAA